MIDHVSVAVSDLDDGTRLCVLTLGLDMLPTLLATADEVIE